MSAKDDSFNTSGRRGRRSGEGDSRARGNARRDNRPGERSERREDGGSRSRAAGRPDRQSDRREDRRDGQRSDRPGNRRNDRADGRFERRSDRAGDRPVRDGQKTFAPSGQRQLPAASAWPAARALFPPMSAETMRILDMLPEALAKVWPLNTAHRRSLPDDVADLSRLLTTERAGLARPYWSSPASISAYLYYFLPWNLVRLTRMLASLPLPDPRSVAPQGGEALLVDVGSGPLTLPLALWLARPQWRTAPLRVLALDTSSQPLELGKTLMEVLGEMTGQPVWPVRVARAPLDQVVRQAAPLLAGGRARPWLVSAANVLNELRFGKKHSRGASAIEDEDEFDSLDGDDPDFDGTSDTGADGEKPEGCREDRLDSFLESLSPLFDHVGAKREENADAPAAVGPALLFVEPGTRLGGSTIMRLRQLAVDGGLTALAPCPHQLDCPLLRGQGGRTWCHFTFGSEGAPLWLEDISLTAGLGKSGLSLSPLLLAALPESPAENGPAVSARVLSAPFLVPGLAGRARYACSGKGMLLLENAEALASGEELTVTVAPGAERDRKSGALKVSPPNSQGERPATPRRDVESRDGRESRDTRNNRENRDGRGDHDRRDGGDRAGKGQRPAYRRDDDTSAGRGPSDRPSRDDRARRDDRPRRDDRQDRRDDRGSQGGRPSRPQGSDRPRRDDRQDKQDKHDRPRRDDRQGKQDRHDRPDRRDDRQDKKDRHDRPAQRPARRPDRQERSSRGGQGRRSGSRNGK